MLRVWPLICALFFLATTTSLPYNTWNHSPEAGDPPEFGSSCTLDPNWSGLWYTNGNRQPLLLNMSTFETKGTCAANVGNNKFVFHLKTPVDDCYRCVYIMDKHANVLQYKESACQRTVPQMDKLCAQIQVDDPLITLFRATRIGQPCALVGPANFTYVDQRGACTLRISTMDTCASADSFRLRFESCSPAGGSGQARTDDYRCLAEWTNKQGRTYFVAQLQTGDDAQVDVSETFRCFIYEKSSSGGQLGISADSSCRELIDIDRAATIIKYQQSSSYPTSQCQFPKYLRSANNNNVRWSSLSDDAEHVFTDSTWTINANRANASSFNCITHEDVGKLQRFVVYVVNGCERGYRCAQIYHRSHEAIEIVYGPTLTSTPLDACADTDAADSAPFDTLLASTSIEQACPARGQYAIHGCPSTKARVSFGCTAAHQLVFSEACDARDVETYNCHSHWSEDGMNYLIAKEQHTGTKVCYMYRLIDDTISMSILSRHPCKWAKLNINEPQLPQSNTRFLFNATILVDSACDPASASAWGINSSPTLSSQTRYLVMALFFLIAKIR